ncbi:LPS O-antigen chain length determinant protein, WzzB/FepE family [Pseudomonas sp. 8Z]|uniref:Wzz/FepE/Etk N-terminal domain-containing protein n=1 Tax=Pseudomonas sp. 8Z TaxID=2653166 RepID=UPI0012F2BDE7|nr:Wzz/FepE/Etk N-terminal domain-containing protein [Pseudomonas sp. 8Z]VXC38405.1 LPS O-antigen chain length determinant protein, WzzB/FepE family [Pseudomonas sp. 8Z]
MSIQPVIPRETRADEIDLVELFHKLWQQKLLIAGCTLAVTLCAAAYAFLSTPSYEVQSVLRPAPLKELDELNSTGVYSLTPEDALKRVGSALESYSTRAEFFRNNPELFANLKGINKSLEQRFEAFNAESFSLIQPDSKRTDNLSDFVGLKLVYPETLDGVEILNGIVQQAIIDERQRVALDMEGVIQNRLNKIERQMAAARASYEAKKEAAIAKLTEDDKLQRAILQDELKALRTELRTRRQNRIAQLDEAISIAKALGITKPTNPTSLGDADNAGGQGNVFRTEVINQQFPLHFMGTEALEAERAALLKRKSDDYTEPKIALIQNKLQMLEHNRQVEMMQSRDNEDLFLAKLSEMREEAARLRSINLDLNQLNLVRIDRPAVKPLNPIKPKKLLIVSLSMVMGFMLGVCVAFLRVVFQRKN